MNVKELLANTVGCVLEPIDPAFIKKYRDCIPSSAPEDLSNLFHDFKKVRIFDDHEKIPANSNSWNLQPSFFTDCPTITDHFGPPLPQDIYFQEYYDNFFMLGTSAADGSHVIGISLHPTSVGIIFDYFVDSFGAPVGMRKIAMSFTEWIEKTLIAGPDGTPYWFKPEFIDLGPAVPDDPYYSISQQ